MPQIDFETELKMNGHTLNILLSGSFVTDDSGEITDILIETWDERASRFNGGTVSLPKGQLFDLAKATLASDYEGDILDALADEAPPVRSYSAPIVLGRAGY